MAREGLAEVVSIGPAVPGNASLPETVITDLEELGLNGSQARVLLAMLSSTTANTAEIALLSGVPRTAVYTVLQELASRRLVAQIGAQGPATWACPGRDEVLERLEAAQEERMARQRDHAVRLRSALTEIFPPSPSTTLPFVHFIPGQNQLKEAYEEILASASSELLVFSRPPYRAPPRPMKRSIIDVVGRGVEARAIFQVADPAVSPEQTAAEVEAYRDAGVESRIIDHLPIKLMIADRRVIMVAIPDPSMRDTGFPTSLLIENEDYARFHASSFETYWNAAQREP